MMKTFRKLVAMVLLLLIYLLTLQIVDAGRNHMNVSNAKSDPKIILEEVIITGTGNNTRVIANTVAEDVSNLDDETLSLLSKREIRGSGRSRQTSGQAATASEEEDLEDLEIMSRVVAKYEPQRLASGKTKRRTAGGSKDVHGNVAGSRTELEKVYTEMLRNLSQKSPKLTVSNADVTLNPYLSLAAKQFKRIYIPKVAIHHATNDGVEKHSDVDFSFTSPTSNGKKSKKLLKKYLQLNFTAVTPRFSGEESETDEESAGGKSTAGYFKVSNGSLSVPTSNVHSSPAEESESYREWNKQNSSIQIVPPFTSQLNNSNSNNIININNLQNSNLPKNDADAVQFPPRYYIVSKPFSTLQSPINSIFTANIGTSYGKPTSSPVGLDRHQQTARSSANVLPLVISTELFNPPPAARHYVPIKRTNYLEGSSAAIVSTEASLSTSPVGERTTLADYDTLYTAVIGTTRSPLATVNSQQNYDLEDYYANTENPTERTVTRTNFTTTYVPSQTSSSYTAQRQKDSDQPAHKNDFLPTIATHDSPDDETSSLNENAGIALYNKFVKLFSANIPDIPDAPKVITRDFKQPVRSSQQVSTLPYVTLKPLTPTSLKVRPITSSEPASYYSDRLLVSQNVGGKHNKNSVGNVEANEQSGVENIDETEKEEDNGDVGSHNTQGNREALKIYKTPNKLRGPVRLSQQQVSTLPYVILKPLTPTSLKVRPIASSISTPYYDSRLLVSQNVGGKHNKNNVGNVETNKQSRVEDETEKEEEDEDNGDVRNHKTQVNQEAPKLYKSTNKLRGKKDREETEEDRNPQQRRNYEYQDKQHAENDRSKNDDGREKYENIRHENNDEEEKVDETEEEESGRYVSAGKSKDEDDDDRHQQYNKFEHNRDNSDAKQREKPQHRKKYNKLNDRLNKHESDVEHRLEGNNKHSKSLHNVDKARERDEKEYCDRPEKKKLVGDNQYKRNRQDRKYKETEDGNVDKPFGQRSKDQRAYRQDEGYEDERNNDDDRHKYHRHQAFPRKDSLREESTREEYHHHKHGSEDQDNGKEDARDHVHGETQEHAHKHEGHHKNKVGGEDYKFAQGGGAEHKEEHHGNEGEKGEKGYKIWHEHEKAKKGHHDKEHSSKYYDEKSGEEKKHEDEGGYHEEHNRGEDGKKTAEFGEKGEHKKGHSTHGEHSVHKKDEFEKKTEFFDEFHEDGGIEKHGAHHHDHDSKKGGHKKKGHHASADHAEKYGKEEKHEKGGHHHEHKGHKVDEGHDHHYDHGQKHGKKEGQEHGKKWNYVKGGHEHKR